MKDIITSTDLVVGASSTLPPPAPSSSSSKRLGSWTRNRKLSVDYTTGVHTSTPPTNTTAAAPPPTTTPAKPEAAAEAHSNLRLPQRFITTYNSDGLGVFDTSTPESFPTDQVGDLSMHFGYATKSFPPNMNDNEDLDAFSNFLTAPPGIISVGGTILRIIDFKPGAITPMHRTVSLDYGVVLEGEIELVLDSGESRLMMRGDVNIQRGTDHLWRNPSQTQWARIMFVVQEAVPLAVNGQTFGNSGMDK